MYTYTSRGARLPDRFQHVWSRSLLQPFAEVLTPFSYSVLAEITPRAWFRYYSRAGHTLAAPPQGIIRQYRGRPYLDVRWIAEQDAAFAGLNPPVLHVDGRDIPVCDPPGNGILSGLRFRHHRRRLREAVDQLIEELPEMRAAARSWFLKTREMRWTQAEILQVMEEIERFGVDTLMVYYATRWALERAYDALLELLRDVDDLTATVRAVMATLSDLEGLEELNLTHAMLELAALAREHPAVMEWLKAREFHDWRQTVPSGPFARGLQELMDRYGHWAMGFSELRNPRWFEQPEFLFHGILACAQRAVEPPARLPSKAAREHLLGQVDGRIRPQVETFLADLRRYTVVQSHALDAYAYILAGTRLWVLAASREGCSDGRLEDPEDIFFFELEEVKRMMTGEWNVSARAEIREVAAQRRQAYHQWLSERPGEVLLDEVELYPLHHGLPGVVGRASGPLRRQQNLQPALCEDAVVGATQLDSGWAPALPVAGGLVEAAGTPLDPIVAAARIWHVPAVVGLGTDYDALVEGAQTTLDAGKAQVEQ